MIFYNLAQFCRIRNQFKVVLFVLSLKSQSAIGQRDHLTLGDKYYNEKFYIEAIQEYKAALEEKVVINKFYMNQQIARTYKMLFDYANAEIWYAKLIELGAENPAENYLHYAQILANNQKYQQSADMYAVYAQKAGKIEESAKFRGLADWATVHINDSLPRVKLYKTNIETGSRSMGLWLNKEKLFFAKPAVDNFTERTSFYDLSTLEKTDSIHFHSPQNLSEVINKSFYEGTPWVSADGSLLFYSSNASIQTKYRKEGKNHKAGLSEAGLNVLYIYTSRYKNNTWSKPVALNINHPEYSCVFPCFSKDMKHLYFSSNMQGGYGGFDLYRAEKLTDSTFGIPVNLGPDINTFQDEMYPFLNDTALFYSSRGLQGYGGADIFIARFNDNSFKTPVNAGKPINSSKDDFSLILMPNEHGLLKGYLSSNREGNHGYDHIWYFSEQPAPLPPDTILATVINRITGRPMEEVAVTLERYEKNKTPVSDSGGFTNSAGKFTFVLLKNVAYRVTFRTDGFKIFVVEIPADDHYDAFAQFGEMTLEPEAKKNTVIQIPNIYFDYDKATIRPESFPVLDQIVKYLNDNPQISIELSAHTDSRGSDGYNLKLSDKRAKSTVKYLIDQGIDAKRLTGKGYGEQKLVNSCKNGVECSEEDHEKNRRVELKVL
jgi:outer membrane protein OmpA-like peptidoglycan-associated protein